ncbi:hypothetical protein ACYOEI_12985 [Singulisphaera rosea]
MCISLLGSILFVDLCAIVLGFFVQLGQESLYYLSGPIVLVTIASILARGRSAIVWSGYGKSLWLLGRRQRLR